MLYASRDIDNRFNESIYKIMALMKAKVRHIFFFFPLYQFKIGIDDSKQREIGITESQLKY